MTLPDISSLTLKELEELSKAVQLAYKAGEIEQNENIEEKKEKVESAISVLRALLGEETGGPSLDNIRGVLRFSDQQMAENSGLAFRLVLQGLEILTKTTLDLAYVNSK